MTQAEQAVIAAASRYVLAVDRFADLDWELSEEQDEEVIALCGRPTQADLDRARRAMERAEEKLRRAVATLANQRGTVPA